MHTEADPNKHYTYEKACKIFPASSTRTKYLDMEVR